MADYVVIYRVFGKYFRHQWEAMAYTKGYKKAGTHIRVERIKLQRVDACMLIDVLNHKCSSALQKYILETTTVYRMTVAQAEWATPTKAD